MTTLAAKSGPVTSEQNRSIADDFARERSRLRAFIRKRVLDERDAEDILQDVFSELVAAYRLPQPIEQVGAWLFRVARNRIVDRFRARRDEVTLAASDTATDTDTDDETPALINLLPDERSGPEAAFARQVLLEQIFIALDELPATQRDVFLAHEIEGVSFKQMAQTSGTSINTLLARKHDAVRHLRTRLRDIFDEYAYRSE
jgi:RNA polymerase sigma factor (sigma-70 family)